MAENLITNGFIEPFETNIKIQSVGIDQISPQEICDQWIPPMDSTLLGEGDQNDLFDPISEFSNEEVHRPFQNHPLQPSWEEESILLKGGFLNDPLKVF